MVKNCVFFPGRIALGLEFILHQANTKTGRASLGLLAAIAAMAILIFVAPRSAAIAGSLLVCAILVLISVRRLYLTAGTLFISSPSLKPEPANWPRITVFIPAHNERAVIARCLSAVAVADYPPEKLEVVVIDDASYDDTGEIASGFADRISGLKILRQGAKQGGIGKPAALVFALDRFNEQDICYFLDADAQIEPDVFKRAAAALSNQKTSAVTGRLEPINPRDSIASFYTAVESWTHQLATLLPASNMNLTCAVLGSNWATRREVLDRYGLDRGHLLEDTNISVAINNDGGKILFDPDMRAGFEVPPTLGEYFRQHVGWNRGFSRIGGRTTLRTITGAGNLMQKFDRLIYSWGYLDRPLIIFLIVMIAVNQWHGLFIAPIWLAIVSLLMPVVQMLAGLIKAKRPLADYLRLPLTLLMFPADICAAITGMLLEFTGAKSRWYKTARTGDESGGKYMNGPGGDVG